MNPTHAPWAKELDRKAIDAAVHALFAAEFAMAVSGHTSAFESYEFLKEHIALSFLPL